MTVLHEIVDWSKDRYPWQRDALRRLAVSGRLSDEDVQELAEICKAGHGLAEPQNVVPLAREHVPDQAGTEAPVSLDSIFHQRGVNALAENQTLGFSPSLTVVYGDNAAGKTGYIRILKSACRARGQEQILGNVVSGTAPHAPVVAIKYRVGSEARTREWAGRGDDEFISRVSVFDTRCAAVYLTEKTDVAFRPFGLDLFDKLVPACKAIRTQLEKEQRSLASNELAHLQAQVPEGTAVAKLLANINSLTKPETVQELSRLSPEEVARLALLERSLLDLKANNPEKLRRELALRAERVRTLARHVHAVETALSPASVEDALAVREKSRRIREQATKLRDGAFPPGVLVGTGSGSWSSLWEAARRFSEELAYIGEPFPAVGDGAQCVLCQQDLDQAARDRLKAFEAFVVSTAERELREAQGAFMEHRDKFTDLEVFSEQVKETLTEIHIEHEGTSRIVEAALMAAESRRGAIDLALREDGDVADDCPDLKPVAIEVDAIVIQLSDRVAALETSIDPEKQEKLNEEAQALRARKVLSEHEEIVLAEIERKRKHAAYELCLRETRTNAITHKSTVLTRKVVTEELRKGFRRELSSLGFRHIEVELEEAGGADGVLYHKLVLTRAPGVELPQVVSEGEQRCLAIASFFAELGSADNRSAIVFDDPVSSLDYRWREGVARRLVEEAKTRQVIVFTHDVVFLLLLKELAEEEEVEQSDQHVRNLAGGAGVCAEELPWVALKVRNRVSHLRKRFQDAEKLHRKGHQDAYEREAVDIYGFLREAWERALEEVLLGGVVERFRGSVQTRQVASLADITDDDCKTVSSAMTKCSRWLRGHDDAPAARAEVPEPAELKQDIEKLDKFLSQIRKRRK
ncbi:MAG: AAA family ATPase [Alphaproteobacteria bacterium]|nr:AAA family ATPase [Alphaproteobacteria bacterium]